MLTLRYSHSKAKSDEIRINIGAHQTLKKGKRRKRAVWLKKGERDRQPILRRKSKMLFCGRLEATVTKND